MYNKIEEYDDHQPYILDGVRLPSVTNILKCLNKPGIPGWANWLGFKHVNYRDELMYAADKGTEVHKMIEAFAKSETMDNLHFFDESYSSFQKFILWKNTNQVTLLENEIRLISNEYKFGGTIDCICNMGGGTEPNTVVDWKTSKQPRLTHFLQLGGYAILLKENRPETYDKLETFGILAIPPGDNQFTWQPITKGFVEEKCVKVFKSVYHTYALTSDLSRSLFNDPNPFE